MKTNLDKYFKTSVDLEKNGVWFDIAEGVGFLVRPFKASNPNVKAAMARLYKPHARQIEMGTMDDAKALEIQVKLFVQACLIGWRGIEIDGKKDVPYDKDLATKFLVGLPDLFETLWKHCQDHKNYQDQEDLGNL